MIRVKFNDTHYKVIDNIQTTKSSREVTFNELTLDFTGKPISALPIKYQEVLVADYDIINDVYIEKEKIFVGYVEDFELPEMKLKDENRRLKLSLLSPMALASLKSVSAMGTYKLETLVRKLIQPLLDDGFVLKEINLKDTEVQVNYLLETIEYCLNRQSNKNNFWWYIDENKNIYINDIDYQFSKEPTLRYDDSNLIKGLSAITPSMEATDYCNVVNFKNVRIYNFSYYFKRFQSVDGEREEIKKEPFIEPGMVVNKNDTITFSHPIDITIENIKKSINSNGLGIKNFISSIGEKILDYPLFCSIGGTEVSIRLVGDNLVFKNCGFTEENTIENRYTFELIRDSFFKNLIVGIRYNGETQLVVDDDSIFSNSALMYTRLRFTDDLEVQKCKGKINKSGQIEKIVDMGEQWKTYDEMREIAKSYIHINNSQVDTITLKIDNYTDENININCSIGDIVEVEKEEFCVNDKYIITDIELNSKQTDKDFKEWTIQARNYNYLENFIDLFRAQEQQEVEDKNNILITTDYQEEKVIEVYEVIEDGS